jgi:asparagine synthase (glutamine-hydrolysing)
MEGILPEPILKRRKMGFPVPIGKWFRGEFRSIVDEYVLGARASDRGVFDQRFIRRLVEQHQFGRANHSERLWALVNFEIWQRQFIDGQNDSQLQPTISGKQLSSHRHNLEATSADYGCHRR